MWFIKLICKCVKSFKYANGARQRVNIITLLQIGEIVEKPEVNIIFLSKVMEF